VGPVNQHVHQLIHDAQRMTNVAAEFVKLVLEIKVTLVIDEDESCTNQAATHQVQASISN